MLKLLIADDEEDIRNGIKNNIDWEENDIAICGMAADGDEALNLIKETTPDILVVDIRMPGLTGLDIIEAVNSSGYPVRSIILSGYDDFSYAQKALKIGAADYLLKPCRSKDILESVLKVKSAIEAENTRKEVFDRLKTQFSESLPILKEKLLTGLLSNEIKITEKVLQNFDLFKVLIKPHHVAVIVLKLVDFSAINKQNSSSDIELMKLAVKNITAEIFKTATNSEVLEHNHQIVVICNTDANKSNAILALCKDVQKSIKEHLWFSVSIGIGNPCPRLEDISRSYRQALKSIELSFILGNGVIIPYDEIQIFDTEKTVYPIREENNLLNSVTLGKSEEFEQLLDEYVTAIVKNNPSKDYIQKSCFAFLLSLYRLCLEKSLEPHAMFGCEVCDFDKLLNLNTLDQIKEKLLEIALRISDALNRYKTHNQIIALSLKYIEENYNKDLTLESVAREVFINPKYLSTLFKQSTGENFTDHIQKIRIEKACGLLKDTRLKSYEIAYKVGYADDKYFCQIFKKIKGLTPVQYRER